MNTNKSKDRARLCKKCGKAIRDLRIGSFTGWIFRSVSCQCQSGVYLAPPQLDSRDKKILDDLAKLEAMPAKGKPSRSTLRIGDVIENRYQIEAEVGFGGMGTVYRASHLALGKSLAIKVLKEDLLSDGEVLARFNQEAMALSRLSNPHIVSVVDCGVTSSNQPFMAMEFIEGRNLSQVISEETSIAPSRLLKIFFQAAAALAHAHNQGVIHRDLKPSNLIIVTDSDVDFVKIVDFGVAKIEELGGSIQMLTRTGDLFGSAAYMSPEQCKGAKVDGRSDIYSLGCVMYEALTGKQAFRGTSLLVVLNQQMSCNPAAPVPIQPLKGREKKLFDELSRLIMRCLNKDPDLRFDSMELLKEEISKVDSRFSDASQKNQTGRWWQVAASFLMGLAIASLLSKAPEFFYPSKPIVTYESAPPLVKYFYKKALEKDRLIAEPTLGDYLAIARTDLERIAIAESYLNELVTTRDLEHARTAFRYVKPFLSRLKNKLDETIDRETPAFTGGAPMLYCDASYAARLARNYAEAVKICKEGMLFTSRQPHGRWLKAKLEQQLAICLYKQRYRKEAESMLKKNILEFEKLAGKPNYNTAESHRWLAEIAFTDANYALAESEVLQGIAILKETKTDSSKIATIYEPSLKRIRDFKMAKTK